MSRTAIYATLILLFSAGGFSQSIYSVSIDTTSVRGNRGTLVFDITSNYPLTNRFDLINFSTDGITGLPQTQGEFTTGDIIQGLNPARFTRIKANSFFTELALPFIEFGDSISFTMNVSETAAVDGRPPDEVSLYLLDQQGRALGTAHGRDGKPNLSIPITGERGGKLEISSPGPGRGREPLSNTIEVPAIVGAPRTKVPFDVTAGWTADDPALDRNAKTFEGDLTEYCRRRCKGEKICTGGAFGIAVNEDVFYAFDDVGNLKAQVLLVEGGKNPLIEGQWGRAKVVGILDPDTQVLTVRSISLF